MKIKHPCLSPTNPLPVAMLLAVGFFITMTVPAAAQDEVSSDWFRQQFGLRNANARDNGSMMKLVRPLTEKVKGSVVQVLCGGRPVALGTVVGADGYILTKRSELNGDPIRVRLADSRVLPARVAVVRRRNDLALLKISTDGDLVPIAMVGETPAIGSFVISPGRRGQPVGLGVLGVTARRVDHNGRLGVLLDDAYVDQALVRGVWPKSGADSAGVKPGDRIVAINNERKTTRESVIRTLHKMFPGESVQLTIVRSGDTLNVDAGIRELDVLQESENDSKVNGPRSVRLSGFQSVIQHDTVLDPDECGGPLLNSSGQPIGINIARAGRVVSYALPGSLIISEMLEMLQQARSSEQ